MSSLASPSVAVRATPRAPRSSADASGGTTTASAVRIDHPAEKPGAAAPGCLWGTLCHEGHRDVGDLDDATAALDHLGDRVVERCAELVGEGRVIGVGIEQIEIARGGVGLCAGIHADVDRAEQAAGVDLADQLLPGRPARV